MRQTRTLFLAMLLSCLLVALSDTVMPLLIGKLVGLMMATDREAALRKAGPMLGMMLVFLLVLRPAALLFDSLLRFNAVMGPLPVWCAGKTTGMWCVRVGRFSRTTLPAALPTA